MMIGVNRLVENWKFHNGVIIAFDFDNTAFDYYNRGYRYDKVITILKECKDMGCTLILSTCYDESKFKFMKNKCMEIGYPH